METHVIYCSACDREVKVVYPMTPEPTDSAGRAVDPSGICMDYCSKSCTGSLCALFSLPPAQMLEKLLESGLIPEA
jgi:hypothetical protein